MRWVCVVILAAGLWTWAQAAGPTTAPTTRSAAVQARIDRLLRQLGAEKWEDRQAAQDELGKMGEDVLPDLQKLRGTTDDEEVRMRAEVAIRQIENTPRFKDGTLTLAAGVTMKFARIPAGKFMMGSPANEVGRQIHEVQHEVTISKPFYMGVTEVTQGQWKAVMGENPSKFKGDDLPVENVSWNDAMEFCRRLQEKGRKVRLPTEAEWEYACRAGTTTPFNTGGTISTDQANYYGNEAYGNGRKGEFRQKTTAAGSFKANEWGLYDMHGNVFEWCYDAYKEDLSRELKDPRIDGGAGASRVLRGGSWYIDPRNCRSAYRILGTPDRRGSSLGFRVVLDFP